MNYSGYRPTYVEIDLKALEHNFFQIKKIVGNYTKILATVKSDAYGHGMVKVAQKLQFLGCDYFGVGSIDEGIILRREGIKKPILILSTVLPDKVSPILDFNLTQTICTKELAKRLNDEAEKEKKKVSVHVKVDTGMGRIGVWYRQALEFIRDVLKYKKITIEGVYTHFPKADIDSEFTLYQIRIFKDLITNLKKSKIDIPLYHAANSVGLFLFKESHLNLVRPGLALYGLSTLSKEIIRRKSISFIPVLNLKTKIVYLKEVEEKRGISYGHTYITKKKTHIATLPIGYADGYFRSLSNKGSVLIRGKRFRICGTICMDSLMVDVGENNFKIGEDVILIGRQKDEIITAEELAEKAQTIPYEVVCNIGNRLPRVYKET